MLKYFKSREFLITIGAILGFVIVSYVIFFFLFLPYYTNHGEETEVPDVGKLKLEEAIARLEEAGLRYEVADSLYLNSLPPLSIISQDPIGHSKVKPDRRVYLTVNKIVAPMVKFPEVTGGTQYQARLRIEGAGLVPGTISYVPSEYANLVLGATFKGKKLKQGEEIRKGSKIDLLVGKGQGNEKVEVPELVGKPYDSAIAIMQRLGLNIGSTRFDPGSAKPQGTILQQHPNFAEGDSIRIGQEMDLWISGPEPGDIPEGGDGVIDGEAKGEKE